MGQKTTYFLVASIVGCALPGYSSAQPGPPFVRGETAAESLDPQALLVRLMSRSAWEYFASKMAMRHSRNPVIHKLAHRLMNHANIIEGSIRALQLKGIRVPPGARLVDTQRQSLNQLNHLRRGPFDARYLSAMEGLYLQLIQDLIAHARMGGHDAMQRLARQMLPRARDNLTAVRDARESL